MLIPDKVLFLDIDGVVLPGRAYLLPNQTNNPFVTIFDPCSVAMLNAVCRSEEFRIVVHSSWIRTSLIGAAQLQGADVREHCVSQGIAADLFHEDWSCDGDISWRYLRIKDWLAKHPEVEDYVILDDIPPETENDLWATPNFFYCDFKEGITTSVIRNIANRK